MVAVSEDGQVCGERVRRELSKTLIRRKLSRPHHWCLARTTQMAQRKAIRSIVVSIWSSRENTMTISGNRCKWKGEQWKIGIAARAAPSLDSPSHHKRSTQFDVNKTLRFTQLIHKHTSLICTREYQRPILQYVIAAYKRRDTRYA